MLFFHKVMTNTWQNFRITFLASMIGSLHRSLNISNGKKKREEEILYLWLLMVEAYFYVICAFEFRILKICFRSVIKLVWTLLLYNLNPFIKHFWLFLSSPRWKHCAPKLGEKNTFHMVTNKVFHIHEVCFYPLCISL